MVYPGVIYFDNGLHEYFKIDLDSLPDKLSPIANFTTENSPGWTVIDECIYFIGGIKEVNETKHFTVSMKNGFRLSDLPLLEYKHLMDIRATGRLSSLIDILLRLKGDDSASTLHPQS